MKAYPAHENDTNQKGEFENYGILWCWHKRYSLGDKKPANAEMNPEKLPSGSVFVKVWGYEHGGLIVRAGENNPFSCAWDSGQLGYIWMDGETLASGFGNNKKRAIESLIMEVENYNEYLQGEEGE